MQIDSSFRVDVPADAAWRSFLDLERIAPACPARRCRASTAPIRTVS